MRGNTADEDVDFNDLPTNLGRVEPAAVVQPAQTTIKTDHPSAFDRDLPHAPEAEAAVLGCCLIDADASNSTISRAQSDGITSADFFEPANGILYREIIRLQNEAPPVTVWMLLGHLMTNDLLKAAGGQPRIVEFTKTGPTTAHAKKYIAEVLDCSRRRKLITAAQRYIKEATQPDAKAADLVAELHADLNRITDSRPGFGSGITAATLCAKPPPVPPELIASVLYQGGTMMFSGPSKSRKTYTFLDLGLSVATGSDWMGFTTTKASVIYLNFELSEHSFARRLVAICHAKGIAPPANFHSWNLRGRTVTMGTLSAELPRLIKANSAGLVIVDPWYKISAQSGAEENSNDGQARILSEAERIVTTNGAALVVGHHFAKGEAASKNAIDRAAGAGAMARWGDVIATMSEHQEPDAMTLDMFLRDFAPVAPFALRWQLPLWQRDANLDPAKLKRTGRNDLHPASVLLEKLSPQGMSNSEWKKTSGWSPSTYDRKRDELERAGKVQCLMNLWKPC